MKNKKYNYYNFILELKLNFPSLVEEIEDDMIAGLLHLQMAVLARYVQQCIAAHNRKEYSKVISFIEDVNNNCTDRVENAIYVSFFENLDFTKENKWAYDVLPKKLKEISDAVESFW